MAGTEDRQGLQELFLRLRFLAMAIIVYRIGTHIPLPGIDPRQLEIMFQQNQDTLLGLFNVFSGGALERMSILALGVVPYITASIIMQMLSAVNPYLEQLRKEGELGQQKISQYTRYLTVVLATTQALGMSTAVAAQGLVYDPGTSFYVTSVLSLVTGSIFMMWLGEQITERGVGNGISMLIFAGIVASLPVALGQSIEQARLGVLRPLLLVFVLAIAAAVMYIIVRIERGQRRIPLNHARQQRGTAQGGHLPLKINVAGVVPAIFASSILLFPRSMAQWFSASGDGSDWLEDIAFAISPGQPLNTALFAFLIFFFCFFYASLVFNPRDVADNIKRSGSFVPGIRPGEQTASYIDGVLTRLTLFGATYITLVCLLPEFLISAWSVPFYLGGTSMLIVVVVTMDFLAQVQAHLMGHQYKSMMSKANLIKGFGAQRRKT
jgi:preprotein translocase subunit SecY